MLAARTEVNETHIYLFGSDEVQYVWCGPDQDYHNDCIMPKMKNRGGSVLIWNSMSTKGVGDMTFVYPNTEWKGDSESQEEFDNETYDLAWIESH